MSDAAEPSTPRHFREQRWNGSTFEQVDFTGASFRQVRFTDALIQNAELSGVRFRDIESRRMVIEGDVEVLLLNGVDVVPLFRAELDRRHPERLMLRPADADGYRAALPVIEAMWEPTIERARGLDPALLHERVNGEWSFLQTLRHLVFATESWIHRVLLGDPVPWHPLSLPFDGMPILPEIPNDVDARPTLDEVLAIRADRLGTLRRVLDDLTDEQLGGSTEPVEGPGFPIPRAYPVKGVFDVVLDEEWWHHRFAVRDLDALTA